MTEYELLTRDDKTGLISKMDGDKIELISKIESIKTSLIKWFVAFFITLVLMIAGLYLKH